MGSLVFQHHILKKKKKKALTGNVIIAWIDY